MHIKTSLRSVYCVWLQTLPICAHSPTGQMVYIFLECTQQFLRIAHHAFHIHIGTNLHR